MKNQMPAWMLVTLSSGTGALVMFVLVLGMSALAEDTELDEGPRVVPYNGVLEFNGAAFNGLADFQFTLTDDADCNFVEDHDNVSVFAGRFTANIGSVSGDLPTCMFDTDQVFIQVAVREAEDEGLHRSLAGRQKINPVPFAYWSAEGSDFKIDGNASVGGVLSVPNIASLSSINGGGNAFSTGGDVNVGGGLSVTNNAALSTATTTGNVTIGGTLGVNGNISDSDSDVTIADGLIVTGNISDSNSDVTIADGLIVTGSISDSNSDVTINDNLDITGNIQDTNGDVVIQDGLDVNGTLEITGNLSDSNSTELTLNDGLDVRGNIRNQGNGAVVTINDGLNVNGAVLRRIYNRDPDTNDTTLLKDSNNNNININRSLCMINKVENFNENNDRCHLDYDGNGNWRYEKRDGDCNVMCFTWN